jgi:hypothetical protein
MRVTLLTPQTAFAPQAMTVATPCADGVGPAATTGRRSRKSSGLGYAVREGREERGTPVARAFNRGFGQKRTSEVPF